MEAQCELIRHLEGGWTREYRDLSTGNLWHATYLHSEWQGGGLPYWVRIPMPGTAALVDLASQASEVDDRLVAAHLLSDAPETWAALVRSWEARVQTDGPARWLADAVRATGMLASGNQRPTLGKSPAEIDADCAHFQELASRAAALVAQADMAASDA